MVIMTFQPTLAVVVQEKPNGGSILSLVIERKRGNYDSVSVNYEVGGSVTFLLLLHETCSTGPFFSDLLFCAFRR